MRQTNPYFDVKEHLRILHRQVMPIFFVLCSIVMILFIVIRAGQEGAELPAEGSLARVGLLSPKSGTAFDPAFAVLSPSELVLAPAVVRIDGPRFSLGTTPGGERRAVADGRVVFAGPWGGGQAVVLAHDRGGEIVETRFSGLTSVRVTVGSQVRRGETIGSVTDNQGGEEGFHFHPFPALVAGPVPGEVGTFPETEAIRVSDRLAEPPAGSPIEPSALKLESANP